MKLLAAHLIVAISHLINTLKGRKMMDILFYVSTFCIGWFISPYVSFVADKAIDKAILLKGKVVTTWKKYVRKTK